MANCEAFADNDTLVAYVLDVDINRCRIRQVAQADAIGFDRISRKMRKKKIETAKSNSNKLTDTFVVEDSPALV